MILRHSVPTMGRCLGVFFLLLLGTSCCCTGVSGIGVNYGTVANNLPNAAQVVELLQTTYISKVKLYSADPSILSAFANSGIQVVVGVTNDQLAPMAASESYAQQWVSTNVASHYPATSIIAIAVGNEILTSAPNSSANLVPAMQNLHTGLLNLGLSDKIKVSTPHSFGVLDKSYPPSQGVFRTDLAGPIFAPLLDFLEQTASPFMINAYPYFAYRDNPKVSISYALFEPNANVMDSATGLSYTNLFDAQVDATYAAMAKLGHQDIKVTVSETGWPSFGDAGEVGASVTNAQTYNQNLLQHINSNTGTPGRPGVPIDTYIFSLFNENQKPGPGSEHNFGLFLPDRTTAYNVGLTIGTNGSSTTPPPPMVLTPSPPPAIAASPPPPTTVTPQPPPPSSPSPPPFSIPPPPTTNSSSPPPPFTNSSPPPASNGTTAPPPPFTAPPPPYPVPHTPPSGGTPTPSPPPPATGTPPFFASPPPPPSTTSPAPAPPATASPPPATASPPPASPSPPPPPSFFTPPPSTASPPPPVVTPSPPPAAAASPPPPPPAVAASPPPPVASSPPPAASSPPPPAAGTTPPASPAPPVSPAPPATAPPGTPPAAPGTPSGPNTWCVAKPGSPATDLTTALNYACGEGGADCTEIQSGAPCFLPNTLFSHASYAFTSYYAKNGRNYWNCYFGNSSLITITNPSYTGCNYP